MPPEPTPGRWPTLVLLLVTSLGVPAGVLALVGDERWIRDNPGLALGLLAVYEGLVLLGGFIKDVWSGLRSKWVDRLADWVDRWITTTFSLFRRRYLKWIFYQHRDFDVKGLSTQGTYNLELEHVFVDLTIEPKPAHATTTDPIRPVPEELAGRRQIWAYLKSKDFKDNLVLIGPPGSGKTTLLKKIALHMTTRRRPRLRETIPVLLFLREHAEAIRENPNYSLAEAVKTMLARKEGPVPPDGWLEKKLAAGRCLVLLDGLDEVAAVEIRQQVVAWVEARMQAHPENRFLITSRPHGYRSNPIAGVTVLEVQSFNRDQIRTFVHNWYRANEIRASGKIDPGVEMKAREGAEDLLRRLGNSQTLTDLAVNPLLLTMIATVHRFRSSLPGRRVELYAEICEVFLGKRQQARGIETDLTPSQKQRVLQPLAYHLMCARKREISIDEAKPVIAETLRRVAGERGADAEENFLNDVESGSGLLLQRESRLYSFAHLAFQEYLAAVHARELGLAGEVVDKVSDSWWHETLRLYGAQGDASPILAACLSVSQPSVTALTLAIDCLEESREIDPEWRARINSLLDQGVEDQDPERFRIAAEALLTRRLRDMTQIGDRTFIDSSYVTHAEYQLFLADMASAGQIHPPDHWKVLRFQEGKAMEPIAGVRLSDAKAFCAWLSKSDPAFAFRLPAPAEVNKNYFREQRSGRQIHAMGYWLETGVWLGPEEADSDAPVDLNYFTDLISNDLEESKYEYRMDYTLRTRLEHALALDRDRELAHRNRTELKLEPEVMRELDFYAALARDVESLKRFSRDVDPTVVLNAARHTLIASTRQYYLNIDFSLNYFGVDMSLTRAFQRALDRSLSFRPFHDQEALAKLVRRTARLFSLRSILISRRNRTMYESWPQPFIDLAILEARIEGVVPAVEGIRLVKERRA